MRKNGIEIPGPTPDPGALGGAERSITGVEDAALEAAHEQCKKYAPDDGRPIEMT